MAGIHSRPELRPVINAAGSMTVLGASRVLGAIADRVAEILGEFGLVDDRASLPWAEPL